MSEAGEHHTAPRMRPLWIHFTVGLLLLVFVLLLYAPLLFTNRVLAAGDILHYFYPYRDYAAEAIRNGRIPLWNPYIFLGAPFLANPQAAVLYPLHWPLSWLDVTKQLYWSAAIHTWLLAFGGYLLLRRWRYSAAAGLATALVLAGSGFYGGLVGHINQMNGAAWLTWGVLVIERTIAAPWRQPADVTQATVEVDTASPPISSLLISTIFIALLTALMLLAGHTQTLYINLFGLGVWIVWPLVNRETMRRPWTRVKMVLPTLVVYAGGAILGAGIGAVQLLPTLELSGLGLRRGGLSYQEVSSFSLKPLHLLWTLLPSYGLADLGVVFGTAGYTEFVAYVGLVGLALAALGAWTGQGRARTFGLLFAGLGLLLALGRWNPIYYMLYEIVPGFDLFRTPARWMMLYTLGMAVLAGVGLAEIGRIGRWPGKDLRLRVSDVQVQLLTLVLLAAELLIAAQALPHTHPTAPQAVYDLRTAPAHLLTDPVRATLGPAASGRFLSMSTTTYDPGDMGDYRRLFLDGDPPQLDEAAFADFVDAVKSQEVLAPNLSLLRRVPAVDGFDGGVLPLQRYLRLLTLFIPPDRLVPDGRLREQLTTVPDSDLLGMVNAQYVITDKVRDLWYEGVYYDRQIGARLDTTAPVVHIAAPLSFEATHVDVIGYVDGAAIILDSLAATARPVAELTVQGGGVEITPDVIEAGGAQRAHFADDKLDSPMAAASGATVVYRDVEGGRQEYRARLALPSPMMPAAIAVTALDQEVAVVIRAVTLYDDRTGMFTALLPSDRGDFRLVHSGDVKIYENLDVLPRVRLLYDRQPVADVDAALTLLASGAIDPVNRAVVETVHGPPISPVEEPTGAITLVSYAAEQIVARVATNTPALLVIADSYYPGWTAQIDGEDAPVLPVNAMLRGVFTPVGEHVVTLTYAPRSWRVGLWLSGMSLLGTVLLLFAVTVVRFRGAARHEV